MNIHICIYTYIYIHTRVYIFYVWTYVSMCGWCCIFGIELRWLIACFRAAASQNAESNMTCCDVSLSDSDRTIDARMGATEKPVCHTTPLCHHVPNVIVKTEMGQLSYSCFINKQVSWVGWTKQVKETMFLTALTHLINLISLSLSSLSLSPSLSLHRQSI